MTSTDLMLLCYVKCHEWETSDFDYGRRLVSKTAWYSGGLGVTVCTTNMAMLLQSKLVQAKQRNDSMDGAKKDCFI